MFNSEFIAQSANNKTWVQSKQRKKFMKYRSGSFATKNHKLRWQWPWRPPNLNCRACVRAWSSFSELSWDLNATHGCSLYSLPVQTIPVLTTVDLIGLSYATMCLQCLSHLCCPSPRLFRSTCFCNHPSHRWRQLLSFFYPYGVRKSVSLHSHILMFTCCSHSDLES